MCECNWYYLFGRCLNMCSLLAAYCYDHEETQTYPIFKLVCLHFFLHDHEHIRCSKNLSNYILHCPIVRAHKLHTACIHRLRVDICGLVSKRSLSILNCTSDVQRPQIFQGNSAVPSCLSHSD